MRVNYSICDWCKGDIKDGNEIKIKTSAKIWCCYSEYWDLEELELCSSCARKYKEIIIKFHKDIREG